MSGWWTRNDDGFWCNVCGDLIKPEFHFDSDDEMDAFEPECCTACGAPDDIDPEAV